MRANADVFLHDDEDFEVRPQVLDLPPIDAVVTLAGPGGDVRIFGSRRQLERLRAALDGLLNPAPGPVGVG